MLFKKIKKKICGDVCTLMSATAISQLVPILISPILTRIYPPSDFGILAAYMAIVSIVSGIMCGKYELAILLPKRKKEVAYLINICLILVLISGLVTFLVLILFFSKVETFLNVEDKFTWVLMTLPLSVILAGLYQVGYSRKNRLKKYEELGFSRMLMSGVTVVTQLGFGMISSLGAAGLILATLTGQFIGVRFLWKKYQFQETLVRGIKHRRALLVVAKKHINFPKYDAPATLINVITNQAPNLIMPIVFSAATGGYYNLTQRVLQAPISLISSSYLDVFKQRASEEYNNSGTIKYIYKKTFLHLLLLSLPSATLIYFYIYDIFRIFFGNEWVEAGRYAQLLVPAMALRMIANPLSFVFYIKNKQQINLIGMIITCSITVMALIFSESAIESVGYISTIMCFTYLSYIVIGYKIS